MTQYGRIYIIRNTVNSKIYVGQTTVSIKLRFQNHLSAARNNKDYVIGKAIRKYGQDKFYVELLEECLKEELNEREKYWISFFKATDSRYGYNLSIGGHHPFTTKEINESQVIALFNDGIPAYNSTVDIGKQFNKNKSTIRRILLRNNIELRTFEETKNLKGNLLTSDKDAPRELCNHSSND